ncbi:MAG: Fe-S cluster assembly protein SufD [Methylococcaceae bacterium]|jgi:Fe-S cluster assembly protein SufD
MSSSANPYITEYASNASRLPGQNLPWLQQFRKQALEQFSIHGFPSPREEDWRYTNVSAIEKKLFAPALNAPSNNLDLLALQRYQLADAWSVVLINGHFCAELSQLQGLPEGVCVCSMAAALESPDSKTVEKYLGLAVTNTEHSFVAFNSAWFSDGVLVRVPEKLVLSKPIQILNIVTSAEIMATTRSVLIIEQQAQAQVLEMFISLDNVSDKTSDPTQAVGAGLAYLTATVSEVFIGQNAELTLYKAQAESEKAYHFGGVYVQQERDARFTHHNFAFGGLLARTDLHTDLGCAAECELNGLYLGAKRQHIDNHTRINHLQAHASSRQLYKGVLDDRARGVFQGRVLVAEQAQKTDSEMNNRNLLLSADAEVDTKPQLEIYADDVKCGHGLTVGQLDEKSVFYLQSRCVDEETARNMLTFAFANEMVDKVKLKTLHDVLLAQVLARFPQQGVDLEWL